MVTLSAVGCMTADRYPFRAFDYPNIESARAAHVACDFVGIHEREDGSATVLYYMAIINELHQEGQVWKHTKKNAEFEESWTFISQGKPLCSLRKKDETWVASLLHLTGLDACRVTVACYGLVDAQLICEQELRGMGWRLLKAVTP
jgi:hypothetical protein